HRDHAADDAGIAAEAATPQAVAQENDAPAVRCVVARAEIAAERRLHTEHSQEVRADAQPRDALRRAVGHERRLPRAKEPHRVEAARAIAPVEERREPDVAGRSVVAPLTD